MAGNSAFELVNEPEWQAGLKNLLRVELRRWWKTRTWWIQTLIWVGMIDFLLLMVVTSKPPQDQPAMKIQELIMIYGIFGGTFTSVGVIIQMQSAILGEKISGTAAWIHSKPVARLAFVLSKFLGNAFGVAVTAILIPGILAFLIITLGKGVDLSVLNFVGGMGIMCVFVFYWLSLTLMLGAFFNSRGAVIGIPIALAFGYQFVLALVAKISPALTNLLPYSLVIPVQGNDVSSITGNVLLGTPPISWIPVFSAAISIVLFVTLGIWRFSREEL